MKSWKSYVTQFCCLAGLCMVTSCASSKNYTLPKQSDFQGYKIIDGVDKKTIQLTVKRSEKIAVVVRNINTTSYTYLEPRYVNTMVTYEGKDDCCTPTKNIMGAAGNLVYQFSFIGKGDTKIRIVARHKGLLTTADHFDDDQVFTIQLHVE